MIHAVRWTGRRIVLGKCLESFSSLTNSESFSSLTNSGFRKFLFLVLTDYISSISVGQNRFTRPGTKKTCVSTIRISKTSIRLLTAVVSTESPNLCKTL